MPKSQTIDPQDVRSAKEVELQPIPVNQYSGTIADELASGRLGRDELRENSVGHATDS